jgi:hypothetical protein
MAVERDRKPRHDLDLSQRIESHEEAMKPEESLTVQHGDVIDWHWLISAA